MIVNWDFYIKRKRINVKNWLESKNIKSYSDLVDATKKLGIETPPEEKVSKYFKKPEAKKNDEEVKKPAPKLDIASSKVSKQPETDFKNRAESKESEKPKRPRKRNTRKKRQPVKKKD
jgi:hypothetical protein